MIVYHIAPRILKLIKENALKNVQKTVLTVTIRIVLSVNLIIFYKKIKPVKKHVLPILTNLEISVLIVKKIA